ncbi:MAG: hypothetical protein QG620_553 [Patescibacteria group bacterium]|nr:hypothetical protein [Patescibacteria group bacterium]
MPYGFYIILLIPVLSTSPKNCNKKAALLGRLVLYKSSQKNNLSLGGGGEIRTLGAG